MSRDLGLSRLDLVALACAAAGAGATAALGASALTLGLPAAAFFALCADGVARPRSSLAYPTVSHGPRDRDRVALTFDDGPDPLVTPLILDVLAKFDARATFFAIGRSVEAHPRIAHDVALAGHELGSHSWSHGRLDGFLAVDQQACEIRRAALTIQELTGATSPPLYRSPMGLKTPPMARAARQLGVTLVAWSLHSRDSRSSDPERIARRVLERIRPGDIVLMHDGHDLPGRHRFGAARALPAILRGLRARRLETVTVSELIGARPLQKLPKEASS